MVEKRQHIEASDKLLISGLLRRIEAARRFPDNTDPSVRHVQIMGETLGKGMPYPMLDEERGHCATSLLAVVAALYEARNAVGLEKCASPNEVKWPTQPAPSVKVGAPRLSELRGLLRPDQVIATDSPSGETVLQREEVCAAWCALPDDLRKDERMTRLYHALGGPRMDDPASTIDGVSVPPPSVPDEKDHP